MKQLINISVQRPKAVIAAWLLLIVVAAPFALKLEGALKAGGFSNPRGASVHAQHTLEQAFHEAPNSLLVVLHDKTGSVADAVDEAGKASRRAGVIGITDDRTHPEWLSKDGRTTFLQVGFSSDNTTVQNLVPDLQRDVRAAVGKSVEADVTGSPALDYALNKHSKEDVTRAEMIAFPVLFVVLLLVFRSVVAMMVPLLMAGGTLVLTQAIGYVMAKTTDVNSLFTNIVSMVGLAVAVDYSLFIVKRFREELAAGQDATGAVDRSMRTVGHSVLFSGMAVVVALSALFIPRSMSFTSIALGGVAVAVVAVLLTMTLLPAVLKLLGHRINAGALRRRGKAAAPASAATTEAAPASRLGGLVSKRPVMILAVLLVGFVALAWPATQLNLRVPVASANILPSSDSARVGIERVKQDIGVRSLFPVEVVLTADAKNSAALLTSATDIAGYAKTAPGVEGVQGVSTLGVPAAALPQALSDGTGLDPAGKAAAAQFWTRVGGNLVTRVLVVPKADPDSASAHQVVGDLRSHLKRDTVTGVKAELAGATATGSDFDKLVTDSIPLVVLAVALLSYLILFVAFRSTVLPLLALAFNGLVVSASLGFLTLVASSADHTINSVTPPMLFAVMFGLSMDYMVIMIARMREMYREGASHRDAVLGGLSRTAGLVNGAAAIMVAVFVSFVSAQISIVRELGVSLAAAVILDAIVIRRLVMPATLLLLGDRIWGRTSRTARTAGPAAGSADPAPAGSAAGTVTATDVPAPAPNGL
ncbi:MMPL family transporter [Actinacidiphila acididurans]|uniref:MMPL family transporter n=1 Tax=Actinacidiphila acididurans TaxID=2784346 RepID=A0ABS2TUZ1_9ACTN|nr:MMPL family transporter [Actinacidiphila acididurans]MBM9507154.1 MMPL family transporter [Actinacidiphila acididurans]